ncbi:hypothetical protein KIN20_004213 [Parelaphostrongylus tenuis]|uniref:Uncharacterized protein n=1 Tax=Parelaphostrongylus tenuis TaxID=148309 RepID=A0AAD5M1C5_PARTN|nr:hypothetical protein KIN20_004213 [Parelaphostrongylus tenuis]
MSPSGGDPYRSPPIIRKRTAFPLIIIFRKLFGLLITILIIFILAAGIPVYLILGIIGFFRKKSKRWSYEQRCCTHQWPISDTGSDLAGVIFAGTVDLETVNKGVRRVVMDSESNLCANCSSDVIQNIGKIWDQSGYRLTMDDELLGLQLQRNVLPADQTTVFLVPDFEHSLKGLMTSSLVLTSTATDCSFICTQRLLCMCIDEKTSFEIESHTPMTGWQQHVHERLPQTAICMTCKFALGGPSSLLALAFRGQNSVWKHLEDKDNLPCRNRRHPRALKHRCSSPMLMDTIPDDTTGDNKSPTHFALRSPSIHRNVVQAVVHRRSWITVEHPELIFRAEKLLRASTCELLLSLVAGALRNHFREQGILHPPDLGCMIPFSARGLTAIGDCCETNLLPLELPTSVEGAIPRLWAVQKRVAKVVRGSTSGAVAIARGLARLCLPASAAKRALRIVYRSHGVYFAFYRINSEAQLRTIFVFPSLITSLKAAFVFVQHGNSIDVSVSLCNRTFPHLDQVLHSFQRETRLFLDHLSLRLLSLPQITVLPGVSACFGHERNENESDNKTFSFAHSDREYVNDHVDEYSLEELYRLLDVVQNDLDNMRSNPESNRRGHYIQRLTTLEEKMQKFHECISQKLNAETVGVVSGDNEVGDAIANVLAPYRDEPGTSGMRRFSREYSRTETSSTSRKSSRASI